MIADLNTPRYQLPFDQLPRGFVPFPQRAHAAAAFLQQKTGFTFTPEQLREQLEIETLTYFYQDYPVAYRSVEGGLEVLAVGPVEVDPYWASTDPTVKVVQP